MAKEKWLLCRRCIDAIKSRGEIVYVGPQAYDCTYDDEEKVCEWCEEEDDLFECYQ